MHQHDWFTSQIATQRTTAAEQTAATHRLRVVAGLDSRSRLVRRLGRVVTALEARGEVRQHEAVGDPVVAADDFVRAA